MGKRANISCVIPTYNAEWQLQLCLDSIRRQTTQPKEVIVVDDGSDQNKVVVNRNLCKHYEAIYIEVPVVGYKHWTKCKCMNIGTEKARGKHIQYLDQDSVLPPDMFKTNLKVVGDVPRGIVLPVKKSVANENSFAECYGKGLPWHHLTYWQFGTPWGNNFSKIGNYRSGHLGSIHSNIFMDAGRAKKVMWDEKITGGGGGDDDFLRRSVIDGGIILYMEDMEVIHTAAQNSPWFKMKTKEASKHQNAKENRLSDQFNKGVEKGRELLRRKGYEI